ncbi:Plus3 domain-containing protein [Mycena indigotica]|uniref:Plus3 domain-containing protein n=1 Tax=Mycena indigotica TaxID=2126181 RepID=A0A8H6S4G4_9AGAR|nr:Plus3 domain-containing protein [Mycena indigotica]KAF7292729.1 Plus3 domain-containing protein [Mycena indigotica]
MSSELDEELLELVDGGSERPVSRKRPRDSSGKSSNKKRKTADSDAEPESEDDDDARGSSRPRNANTSEEGDKYPLEGKYIDEADREELLGKTEIEREQILAARLDEVERIRDRKHLDKLRQQQIAGVVGTSADEDRGSGAARRTARSLPKDHTKDRSLTALKAKRKAKDEKKRDPSSPRPRSHSPDDMDMSSDEEKAEADNDTRPERRERDTLDGPMTLEALKRITVKRDDLAKHSSSPFFEQIIDVGCAIVLDPRAANPYIDCVKSEVLFPFLQSHPNFTISTEIVPSPKPYEMERLGRKVTMNDAFELKHGSAEKVWAMSQASNTEFKDEEYKRLVDTYAHDKISFPTVREAAERHMEQQKYLTKLVTEAWFSEDVKNMIARKRGNAPTSNSVVLERARLTAARKLAVNRHDNAEVAQIDEQLRLLNESNTNVAVRETQEDKLAKVNERNRKANMEAVRRAELEAAERKRRERKAAASGTSTPTTRAYDPSARLRTVPRTFESSTPGGTRASTPNPTTANVANTSSAVATHGLGKSLNAVAQAIEVDLGDF